MGLAFMPEVFISQVMEPLEAPQPTAPEAVAVVGAGH
jgi:hypothetical protein